MYMKIEWCDYSKTYIRSISDFSYSLPVGLDMTAQLSNFLGIVSKDAAGIEHCYPTN